MKPIDRFIESFQGITAGCNRIQENSPQNQTQSLLMSRSSIQKALEGFEHDQIKGYAPVDLAGQLQEDCNDAS